MCQAQCHISPAQLAVFDFFAKNAFQYRRQSNDYYFLLLLLLWGETESFGT
jgi:hypothetical protein